MGSDKFVDITGNKYGSLTVKEHIASNVWACDCDCGGSKDVKAWLLTNGRVKTCGNCRANIDANIEKEAKAKKITSKSNIGRPKRDSALGILAEIRKYSDGMVDIKYVKNELIDIFISLHEDKEINFLETILEKKWYCQSDLLSWINYYTDKDKEIEILGRKIEELIQGRIKNLVATNNGAQSFMKFVLESDFAYSKKNKSVGKKSATNKVKSKSLDTLLGLIDKDEEDKIEEEQVDE